MTLMPLISSMARWPVQAVRFAGLLAALAIGGGVLEAILSLRSV